MHRSNTKRTLWEQIRRIGNILSWAFFIIVGIFYFMMSSIHHDKFPKLYPQGIDQKLSEVEQTAVEAHKIFAVPGGEPTGKNFFSRRPDIPGLSMAKQYSTTASWDELRRYYIELAAKEGWILKSEYDESPGRHVLEFRKGTADDKYTLAIGMKDNITYVVGFYWRGLSITGR